MNISIILLSFGFVLSAFLSPIGDCQGTISTTELKNSVNWFGFSLIPKIPNYKTENIFISPFSLSTAFGMLWAGADGTTETQLSKILKLNLAFSAIFTDDDIKNQYKSAIQTENNPTSTTIKVANKIVVTNQSNFLLQSYKDDVQLKFLASIDPVNFSLANLPVIKNMVNTWVSGATNGKITSILNDGDITTSTKIILLNAIYFKANWHIKFNPLLTSSGDFYITPSKKIGFFTIAGKKNTGVSYMKSLNRTLKYYRIDDTTTKADFFEIPYKDNETSMFVVLPTAIDGLTSLLTKMNQFSNNLPGYFAAMGDATIDLSMPKFKFELEYPMHDILKTIDDPTPTPVNVFTAAANLSKISSTGGLYVDQVIHKTFVEVNEDGTEAAGTTGIMVCTTRKGCNDIPKKINVDHPFLFFIRDNRNGMILFIGIVNKLGTPSLVISDPIGKVPISGVPTVG